MEDAELIRINLNRQRGHVQALDPARAIYPLEKKENLPFGTPRSSSNS